MDPTQAPPHRGHRAASTRCVALHVWHAPTRCTSSGRSLHCSGLALLVGKAVSASSSGPLRQAAPSPLRGSAAWEVCPPAARHTGACPMPPEPTWLPPLLVPRPPGASWPKAFQTHYRCLCPSPYPPWTSLNVPLLLHVPSRADTLRLPPLRLFFLVWLV